MIFAERSLETSPRFCLASLSQVSETAILSSSFATHAVKLSLSLSLAILIVSSLHLGYAAWTERRRYVFITDAFIMFFNMNNVSVDVNLNHLIIHIQLLIDICKHNLDIDTLKQCHRLLLYLRCLCIDN